MKLKALALWCFAECNPRLNHAIQPLQASLFPSHLEGPDSAVPSYPKSAIFEPCRFSSLATLANSTMEQSPLDFYALH